MYLGWVFGSLLKVLTGIVDLAFVNFIKKEMNKCCLFSGTSDRHKFTLVLCGTGWEGEG